MERDDSVFLRHVLDAARQLQQYVARRAREDLDLDPMLRDAVIRQLEIIGEAANRVSQAFRQGHPEVPWAKIVAMRNQLIHGYMTVDLDLVWGSAEIDVPRLLALLEPLASSEAERGGP